MSNARFSLPGGRDYLTPQGGAPQPMAQLFLTAIDSIDSEESSPKYIGVKIHRSLPVLKFEFPIEWKIVETCHWVQFTLINDNT